MAKDGDAPKSALTKRGSTHMKKLVIVVALGFAVIGGAQLP
jgi:hypothetical protein